MKNAQAYDSWRIKSEDLLLHCFDDFHQYDAHQVDKDLRV